MKSFLSDRQQYVEINEKCSSLKYSNTGLPQGSILGPLLFIVYFDDVIEIIMEENIMEENMTLPYLLLQII